VGQVTVGGAPGLPSVRIELNPPALKSTASASSQVRTALSGAMPIRPRDISRTACACGKWGANDQIFQASDYEPLVVAVTTLPGPCLPMLEILTAGALTCHCLIPAVILPRGSDFCRNCSVVQEISCWPTISRSRAVHVVAPRAVV